MKHHLFIRSYRGDLPWLKYSLRSLLQFASGFDSIVLTFPARDWLHFHAMIGREFGHIPALKLHAVPWFPNDYIGQQNTKLHADLYTGLDGAVTFWDSDAVATGPLRPEMLYDQGKILYLLTPYEALKADAVEVWQKSTEKWLGHPVESEFMRRLPITVYASHLTELRRWFRRRHGRPLWQALLGVKGHAFSEFNLMGAWVYNHHRESYRWLNTLEEQAAPLPCRQFWSWGGFTPEVVAELETLLGEGKEKTGDLRVDPAPCWWLWPQQRHLRRLGRWAQGEGSWMRLGRLRQYPPRPLRLPKPRPGGKGTLPSIALVTPSYNQARFLEATLSSVLDQGYPDLRYAVMDGGSTDGSAELIERHRPRLAHAQSARDKGQADAIARGFECVSGEIMGWLNSDDILLPGSLEAVGRYFARHPEVDVVYSHRIIIDAEGDEIGRWILPPHDAETLRLVDLIPQETCFWRRAIWEKVGGIDPSFQFAMDWDLFLRFQAVGARFHRLPGFLGCFRVHEEQKTSSVYETVGAREVARLHQRELGRLPERREIDRATKRATRRSTWQLRLGGGLTLGRGRPIPRLGP